MADNKDYKKQYHLKQMELNSLLEITEAINNNLPETHIYSRVILTLHEVVLDFHSIFRA